MSVGVREVGIDIRARDMASAAIRQVGGALQNLGGEAEKTTQKTGILGKTMGWVGQGMSMALGFSVMGKVQQGFAMARNAVIGYNATIESSTMAMTTMLGSAEDAKNMISDLQKIANTSPFELPGLLQATQNMIAYGFEAKRIPELMTTIGDAAAGLGGSPMKIDAITRALGQMQAKGKVSGEEMRQLAEQGVPALQYLAKAFGKTTPEISKMLEKGVIPLDEGMEALLAGMKQDYAGMMKDQARTFNGAMSTIRDSINGVIGTAMKPLFDIISATALKLADFLSSPKAMEFANAFASAFKGVISVFTDFGGTVEKVTKFISGAGLAGGIDNLRIKFIMFRDDAIEGISDILDGISGRLFDMSGAMKPLAPIITPLATAFDKAASAIKGFLTIGKPLATFDFAAVFDDLSKAASAAEETLNKFVDDALPQVEEFVKKAAIGFSEVLPKALEALAPVAGRVLEGMMTGTQRAVMMLGDFAMALVDWISPAIPAVVAALAEFGEAIFNYLLQALPIFWRQLMQWGSKLVDWILERLPAALEALSGFAQALFDWIINVGVPKAAEALGPLALEFIEWIGETLPKVMEGLGLMVDAILNFIVKNGPTLALKLVGWAVEFAMWIIRNIPTILVNLGKMLFAIVKWIGETVQKIQIAAVKLGMGLAEGIMDFILGRKGNPGIVKMLTDFVTKTLVPTILGFGLKLWSAGTKIAGDFAKGFANTLVGGIEWAVNSIIDGINGLIRMINTVGDFVGIRLGYLSKIKLPRFEKGTWEVKESGVAYIHEGEMIIPASVAESLRRLAQGQQTTGGGVARGTGAFALPAGPSPVPAMSGGSVMNLTVINNFGRDSIRSDDDIDKISRSIAERGRLLGLQTRVVGSQRLG